MLQKILSSGVVVVRKEGDDYLFLLLRAFRHWDFPKGVVEEGEGPLEGAKREVREETTITDLNFKWNEGFIETGPYGRGKVARYYLAVTDTADISLPDNPEIGKPEHDEFRWVTYQEAKPLLSARVRSVLEWAQNQLKYS